MRKYIKYAISKMSGALGYELHITRKNGSKHLEIFDKFLLSSYYKENRIREAYIKSLENTGMSWADNFSTQCRYHILYQMAEHALCNEGDFVECGCWKGQSAYLIASILKEHGFRNRFYIFDSFEGLSDLSHKDKNERRNLSVEEIEAQRKVFSSTQEEVLENLREFTFITLFEGWIPQRFSEVTEKKFSFVHLDVDLYQPYLDSLNFFYPRLVEGGVICVDDYGLTQFPGAKSAVDECFRDESPSLFLEIPTGGAFVIK